MQQAEITFDNGESYEDLCYEAQGAHEADFNGSDLGLGVGSLGQPAAGRETLGAMALRQLGQMTALGLLFFLVAFRRIFWLRS